VIAVEASDTVTDATGGRPTVTVAVPPLPSLVAVIVAAPTVTAVTSPIEDTVATEGLLVHHAVTRPERTLPLASSAVAVAVVVSPITSEDFPKSTATLATGVGPVAPPPPPQLIAAKHNAIAARLTLTAVSR